MGKSKINYLLLILSMIAWGSLYPVSKHLMLDINPLFLAFLRYSTAVIALLPFFIIDILKNSNKIDFNSMITAGGAGLAGVTIFSVFLFSGLSLSTASSGSVLTNTQPVFTAIMAPLFLGESLTGTQAAGIAAGIVGILIVVTQGSMEVLSGEGTILTGNLLLICGAVSMSLYGIILKSSIKKIGGLSATWLSMFTGTVFLLIVVLVTGNSDFTAISAFTAAQNLLTLFMGVVSTAVAYLLFNTALKEIDVIKATGFKFLIPVTGVGLSIIFIGERPAVPVYAGIIIVFFSVFLIQHNKSQYAEKI